MNGDGMISKDELFILLKSVMEDNPANIQLDLSDEQMQDWVDHTFSEVDIDGNGTIEYAEYCEMIQKHPSILKFLNINTKILDEPFENFHEALMLEKGKEKEKELKKRPSKDIASRKLWFGKKDDSSKSHAQLSPEKKFRKTNNEKDNKYPAFQSFQQLPSTTIQKSKSQGFVKKAKKDSPPTGKAKESPPTKKLSSSDKYSNRLKNSKKIAATTMDNSQWIKEQNKKSGIVKLSDSPNPLLVSYDDSSDSFHRSDGVLSAQKESPRKYSLQLSSKTIVIPKRDEDVDDEKVIGHVSKSPINKK